MESVCGGFTSWFLSFLGDRLMGYMPAVFVKWQVKLSESNVFVSLNHFCPNPN